MRLRTTFLIGAAFLLFAAAGLPLRQAPAAPGPTVQRMTLLGADTIDRRPAPAPDTTADTAGPVLLGEPVAEPTSPVVELVLETATGSASYYANSLAGRRTASGAPYDPLQLTAAHRRYPFGTRLRVTDLRTERSVEVRVTDRGPFVPGRILDLSRAAAEQLDFIRRGHARVRVDVLEWGGGR